MNKVLQVSILLLIATMFSCKTKAILSNKVELGMTKQEVIEICGDPFKRSAKYDDAKNLQEILYYKEKTWDDAGFSWSTTVVNHVFVFKNGSLVAIEQGDEEHNKQSYNSHFIWIN